MTSTCLVCDDLLRAQDPTEGFAVTAFCSDRCWIEAGKPVTEDDCGACTACEGSGCVACDGTGDDSTDLAKMMNAKLRNVRAA